VNCKTPFEIDKGMNVKKLPHLFFIFLGILLILFIHYSFSNHSLSSSFKNKSTSTKHSMSRSGSKVSSSISSVCLDDENNDENQEGKIALTHAAFLHIHHFPYGSPSFFIFLPHPYLHFPSIYILIQSFRL